jgi:hypothetical protein
MLGLFNDRKEPIKRNPPQDASFAKPREFCSCSYRVPRNDRGEKNANLELSIIGRYADPAPCAWLATCAMRTHRRVLAHASCVRKETQVQYSHFSDRDLVRHYVPCSAVLAF